MLACQTPILLEAISSGSIRTRSLPCIQVCHMVCVSMKINITSPHRRRKLSSVEGGKPGSISVCTESMKHEKENVLNINWLINLMLGGKHTPTFSLWGMTPPPPAPSFPTSLPHNCTISFHPAPPVHPNTQV